MKGIGSPAGDKFFNRGDPATFDYDQNTIFVEDTWTGLSLSTIIPAKTTAVLLSVMAEDVGGMPLPLRFRTTGNSNEKNISMVLSMAIGLNYYHDLLMPTGGAQSIEYHIPVDGIGLIQLTVKGWWK